MSQYNFFFSFFREKYNLLVWSTLSTFEEAVHFLIKGGRNYQDPFFQKSFSYSSVLCLVVFFNLLCVKINSSQKNLLIVPKKSFKNSSSVKRNSYVFNTVRFSKSIFLMGFSKKCVFAESTLFNILFRVLFGFSSLKGLK